MGLAGGDGADPPASTAPTAQPQIADPLAYPRQGLRLARPTGWTAELRDGVIRLRGDAVTVAVVTASRRIAPARLERDLVRALQPSSGKDARRPRSRTRLGDTAARMVELELEDAAGRPVEAAVVTARSRWRTYGVTLLNKSGRPSSTSPAVADVLDSFEFSAPA